jgi:serine phosphatase RsbU (regulator of sigma subunit)
MTTRGAGDRAARGRWVPSRDRSRSRTPERRPLTTDPHVAGDGPFTLLLVEDDDGDAVLVREELEFVGAPVRILRAGSAAEAAALAGPDVDCILLDLNLPDAEGLDALARVQDAAPGLAVVVLTGFADARAGAAAVRAGAQDYLVKGQVDGEALMRVVRYAVGRREAEDARRELAIAALEARENARLERGLLPTPILDDPSIRVLSCSRPGRRRALLGGDFFDVVETPDGEVHVLIGDVCGHGPDEAALGVSLRSAWRALVLSGASPDTVMTTLHRILERERHLPSLFATVCALSIAPGRDRVRMRRAGHLPPLLVTPDAMTTLPELPAGPPIGVVEGEWPAAEVPLPPRWTLVLHTDGLSEARVRGGDPLGEDRLRDLLRQHIRAAAAEERPVDLPAVIEEVERLHGGPLRDDVAILVVESLAGPRT